MLDTGACDELYSKQEELAGFVIELGGFLVPFDEAQPVTFLSGEPAPKGHPAVVWSLVCSDVAHMAVDQLPTDVFALLHAGGLVWVVLFAGLLVPEPLPGWPELCCCGLVLAGTVLTALDLGPADGVTAAGLALGLADCALAGLTVALLRRALLGLGPLGVGPLEVTCIKMGWAALWLAPIALAREQISTERPCLQAVFGMSPGQAEWFGLSAAVVWAYQTNLTILTSLAAAVTVGVVESLKTAASYGVVLGLTGASRSGWRFWCGSLAMLAGGAAYGLLQLRRRQAPAECESPESLAAPLCPEEAPSELK